MKKKVVHVVTTMNRGGLESLIMSLFKQMKSDFEFIFIVQKRGNQKYFDEIEALGGKIHLVPRENIIDYLFFIPRLDKILNTIGANILHSHIDTLSAIPLMVSKKQDYKIRISHSHTSNQEVDLLYPIKFLMKKLIRFYATDAIACTMAAGNWMFGRKTFFHYIPNAIETDRFRFSALKRDFVRDKFGWESKFVIGHVGRFNKVKNHAFLIEVFREFSITNNDSILVLIGEGPLREQVFQKVCSYGLENKVFFIEPSDKVDHYYCSFDTFVFPSLFEGMSLAVLEAQTSGLRCLLSNTISSDSIFYLNSTILDIKDSPSYWANNITKKFYDRDRESSELLDFIIRLDIKSASSKLSEIYESKD